MYTTDQFGGMMLLLRFRIIEFYGGPGEMNADPVHAPRSLVGLYNLINWFARLSLIVMALGTTLTLAAAQDWPQRPIMLIVPYPPGGTTDFQARVMSERLAAKLGQPVVVLNKPGASGIVATEFVIRSKPDGYTLLFGTSGQTTSVPMTEKVDYKLDDLIPISACGNGPMVLAVNATMPIHSLKEFIDYVKANPDKYTYASAGIGSVTHLVGTLLVARAGLHALHVPFRGAGPAVAALIGGHVDFYFGNSGDLLPHANDDHIRIIGVSTLKRMPQLPDIPAVSELIPGFEMTVWEGFLAPAHTPRPIIDRLAKEISSIAKEPDVIKILGAAGVQATSTTEAQYKEIIHKEQGIYAEAVQAAGLKRN